ncbi:hypothetical protein Tcan_00828, partial [Toxocara canis]
MNERWMTAELNSLHEYVAVETVVMNIALKHLVNSKQVTNRVHSDHLNEKKKFHESTTPELILITNRNTLQSSITFIWKIQFYFQTGSIVEVKQIQTNIGEIKPNENKHIRHNLPNESSLKIISLISYCTIHKRH